MDKQILSRYCNEIFNAITDGLMVVGPDGTVLMVNATMERLTGFTSGELVGSSCTVLNCDACELIRSESRDEWCLLFEMGAVRGKRCLLMRKDGSYVSVVKNASLLRDGDGRVMGALEVFTDISEMDRKDLKIEELSRLLITDNGFHGMIGKSPVMLKIYQIVEKAAQSDAPVIIYGESGTGKELVAHAIHEMGRRKDGPFIQFNCAALNEALLESELFGHIRGAFTGAYRHRKGRFEAAHGGDIFLDEIGDIPPATQAKLLRVLETKEVERVGDNNPVRVDVRIISATNRHLPTLLNEGRFRQDLFFRINVVPIHLPPLRERKEDIPSLVTAFAGKLRSATGKSITGVSRSVMDLFMRYEWPGNVRELKSAIEYAFVVAESGVIEIDHLPALFEIAASCRGVGRGAVGMPEGEPDGRSVQTEQGMEGPPGMPEDKGGKARRGTVEDPDEKARLVEALRLSNGNKSKAAEILGVHRMTVWNRMKKYGIDLVKKTV